jgi:hypothetical protein
MSKTNAQHQQDSRERRAAAYEIVKNHAMDAGFMQHERDGEGYDKYVMMQQVIDIIKTEAYPYNETSIEEWILEGDITGMTAQQIADEWDEVNSQDS